MSIAHRWNATEASIRGAAQLHLSDEENRWLAEHLQLRVIANGDFLPFSFLNEHQRLRGLSADVLAKISLKTGLKFVAQNSSSLESMISAVKRGDADLLRRSRPARIAISTSISAGHILLRLTCW